MEKIQENSDPTLYYDEYDFIHTDSNENESPKTVENVSKSTVKRKESVSNGKSRWISDQN